MPKIAKTEVERRNCGNMFPAPISFNNINSFDTMKMFGNTKPCPHCVKQTQIDKKDTRITLEDGSKYAV